jgi:uncharacterized membrane protein (DUF4010 family)
LFLDLGIALALGLLVGLQRQHVASPQAGLRTFPLVTLAGAISAALDQWLGSSGWIVGLSALALAALVAVGYTEQLRRSEADPGMTTEVALLLMFLIGAFVMSQERTVAVAVGAATAVLLQFKPELHGIAARLGDRDLRAIMTFALITCVILPVLPNQTYDLYPPLDVLNPFEIWLMVVLMVGISLGGYLLYTFLGRTAGTLLSGILGGAISSTATTLSYARRASTTAHAAPMAASVIMIASSVVFVRVLVEIAVVAPHHFVPLARPIVIMLVASCLAMIAAWLVIQRTVQEMPEQKNPTELGSALIFAALYAGVLMALAAAQHYLGVHGTYAVAVLSGMTDMDAITLSTARLVQLGAANEGLPVNTAWRLIVVAAISNLAFKACMAGSVGGFALLWRIALLFAIPSAVGLTLLAVLP